uniref:Centrosomal protein 104 n=1 Tax=Salmo trutta TaxID=8032 RepID=A0A674ENH8_SALTR
SIPSHRRDMPRKIEFTVVSSFDLEDNFSAKELMVHAPTVNDWRSARFCPYPQEVTLQLAGQSRVCKLLLLAHQYLISGKIEFHIGDRLPEAHSPSLFGTLCRLGCVSRITGFPKSVHMDAIGTYLRITFHRNHVNRCNLYNQVLHYVTLTVNHYLPVNCTSVCPQLSREKLIEHYLNSSQHVTALVATYMGKCESISPLDDLAFDMYQDPEIAHIIHLLDDNKQEMKHCAIEKEDCNTAKKKKEQTEEYRMTVYHHLEVHNLLDMGMLTALPYDKRPLPALQRKRETAQSQPEDPGLTGEPELLTEGAQREASIPIEVYGDRLDIYKKLTEVSAGTPKEELRAEVFLVKTVFQASLKLLWLLLVNQLIPGQALSRAEMAYRVEQTWPNLLSRTGDSATRLQTTATAFIQVSALCRSVKFFHTNLEKPFFGLPQTVSFSFGFISLKALVLSLPLCPFCTGALKHSSTEVRETAVRIVLAIYRLHKNAIPYYLPANDTRKNILHKNIFDGFARIDGQPKSKKGGAQQEGKKDKIRSLQEQLAALKEISVGGAVITAPITSFPSTGQLVCVTPPCCAFISLPIFHCTGFPFLKSFVTPFICGGRCVSQVVEIVSLTEHLLGECENRAGFSQCPRCSEAVLTDKLKGGRGDITDK